MGTNDCANVGHSLVKPAICRRELDSDDGERVQNRMIIIRLRMGRYSSCSSCWTSLPTESNVSTTYDGTTWFITCSSTSLSIICIPTSGSLLSSVTTRNLTKEGLLFRGHISRGQECIRLQTRWFPGFHKTKWKVCWIHKTSINLQNVNFPEIP